MSTPREPSSPPLIPGFEPVRLLGMGGFADVFIYRQQMPAREVAVKVLSSQTIDEGVRERFRTEANLMAQLSQHPAIVTIYHADVASDGRPFLIMELCSRPGLGARYRSEEIPLAEVLRLGVRLSSAVEAAHRMGILHSDIKPANVLTTDFGWPALTDFGIAATIGQAGTSEVGVSIPWSPPELLRAEPDAGDPRSDTYSLLATLYSAVAGRSPFEIPGGANGPADLMHRIEREPLPAIDRADVPTSLALIFEKGLAKRPADRYQTPLEVARALQQVESELNLPVTHVEIAAPDAGTVQTSQADQATRVRPILTVDAPAPPAETSAAQEEGKKRTPIIVAVVSVLAALLISGIAWAALSPHSSAGDDLDPIDSGSGPSKKSAVPTPQELKATVHPGDDEIVVFTWENPDPQPGDQYLWAEVESGAVPQQTLTDQERAQIIIPPTGQACIEVAIVREDRRASDVPAVECGP